MEVKADAKPKYTRTGWGNRLEFFFAMLGSCVGLGNVWRFPFLCYKNGGGAFLIPYVLMVIFVGLPVFLLETGIGQFSSQSTISAWKLSPLFKGVGYASVMVASLVSWYYNVLVAQFLYYLFLSMTDTLPWTGCCNWWGSSPCCRQCDPKDTDCVILTCDGYDTWNTTAGANCTKYNLPAQEFYSTYVLKLTSGIEDYGEPVWQIVLCLLAVWTVVALVLILGAQSFGKVAYFTALFPYVMLTVMLVRGATLNGSDVGVLYYITPDFARLLDPIVWLDAGGQAFYSISAATGVLTALGSYNDFRHPLLRDGLVIVALDMLTSIFSGFVVFCVLGYMSVEKGVPIEDVADGGPGLVFEAYPAALSTMPVAPLWSILFFLMMLTLGLGSSLSAVEGVLISLQDVLKRFMGDDKRKRIALRVSVCMVLFLLGLSMTCGGGSYLLTLVDEAISKFVLFPIAFFECAGIVWAYGYKRFQIDMEFMTGWRPNSLVVAFWTVITPGIIAVILVINIVTYPGPSYGSYKYPGWGIAVEMIFVFAPLLIIPAWMIYYHLKKLGYWIVVKESMLPVLSWGPSDPELRAAYLQRLPDEFKWQTKAGVIQAYTEAMDESYDDMNNKPLISNAVAPMPNAFDNYVAIEESHQQTSGV